MGDQFADGDEAEALFAAGFENRGQGFKSASRVGDAVVENDDGSRNEILRDEPADIPSGGMHWVVRVSATEDASVAALPG